MSKKPTYQELVARIGALEDKIEECRLAEQSLIQNEIRNRLLQDNVPVGLFRFSRAGQFVYANPAARQMFGYGIEEDLSSFNVVDFFKSPTDGRETLASLNRDGKIMSHEVAFKRKDASSFWGSTSAILSKEADNDTVFIYGFVEDITARKHAENDLAREKAFFEAVINSLPGIFYVYDENRRLIKWNRNHETLTGYSAAETMGKAPTDWFDAEAVKHRVSEAVDHVFSKGYGNLEAPIATKDGTRIPHLFTGNRLATSDGTFLLGLGLDISEIHTTKVELQDSKRLLSDIIDFLPDATFVIDTQGNVVIWNRAIEALSGRKAAEIVGKGNYEYAIPFYGTRRPMLIDLVLDWDDEIAAKYVYVKKLGDTLVSETVNPPFAPQPSLFWNTAQVLYSTQGKIIGAIEVIRDLTDRMKAEERLRKSEAKYRSLFENTGTATFIAEADMTVSQMNAKCEELSGFDKAEVEGQMKTSQFVADEDLARIKEYHFGRRGTGRDVPPEYEFQLVAKGGEKKNVIIQVGTIPETEQSIASIIDITPLRRAERKLRVSEKRLRSLVANIPGAVYRCDRDSDWTMHYLSDTIEKICGYPASDFIGSRVRTFTSIIHPEDREMVNRAVNRSIRAGRPFAIDYRIIDVQGEERWVNEHGVGVTMAEGKVQFLDGVIFDVTNRKKMEQSLGENEERLRTLFNAANDAITIMRDKTFVECNRKALEIFGCTRDQFIGQQQAAFSPSRQPDGQNSAEKASSKIRAALNGQPQQFEWFHKRLDGTTFWAHVSLNRVELASGMHIQTITRDITARKMAEEERKVMEAQLRQAQKMEAIGTLAGGIAHDFNNILSAVIGYTEIALDHDLPPDAPARTSLENVLKAGFRAKDLVKQILTFSRQGSTTAMPMAMQSVVTEAVKLLRASLPAHIDIREDLPAEDLNIMGDATQIHQVVMNLCTNAGYAMRDTGGRLDLIMTAVTYARVDRRRPRQLAPGQYVKLLVADTGPGMAPSLLDRIFDPFFTTKPKEEGTGLGLSVVHGIVKEHGGTISVMSETGKGTAVTVHLPLISNVNTRVSMLSGPLPMGSERILLVDDEQDVVTTSQFLLEQLGYDVTSFTESLSALERFTHNPDDFDLVLTDQTMPGLSGDQLASKMMSARPDIPVIICTGYSHKLDQAYAEASGIREVLLKPVTRRDLATAVRRVLDR